jgi:ABC-2 type transport system permease protein
MNILVKDLNNLNRCFALASISARSNYAYLGEVFGRQLFLAAILYIFLRLWKVTYANCGVDHMAGLTLPQMLWYLTITETIVLSECSVSSSIDEEVRSGSLAIQLIRPMSYPIYKLALYLGECSIRTVANLAIGAILCFILVREVPITAAGALALLLLLPLSMMLDFLANFLIGLGAFWIENTNGIFFIYRKLLIISGGMLIPLDLLPQPYSNIAKALPFASMVYGPARQFVHPVYGELLSILFLQIIWIIVLSLIVWQVYKLALKRIAANGG